MNTQYWCRDCETDWEFLEWYMHAQDQSLPTLDVKFCPHCGMRLVNEERPE